MLSDPEIYLASNEAVASPMVIPSAPIAWDPTSVATSMVTRHPPGGRGR